MGDNQEERVNRVWPEFSWKPDRREGNQNEPETRSKKKIVFLAGRRVEREERGEDVSLEKKGEVIRIERCEILRTSASHKMRCAKREKEDRERERERERSEPTHVKKREGKKGRHRRQGELSLTRTYTRKVGGSP